MMAAISIHALINSHVLMVAIKNTTQSSALRLMAINFMSFSEELNRRHFIRVYYVANGKNGVE